MRPGRLQREGLQLLPMLAMVGILSATLTDAVAQESFPNELNSSIDEPLVIVREHTDKVPVRAASREIEQSTDPLVKLAWETREVSRRRLLSTAQHTPWQMMHGLLGLRHDFLISHNNETVNGLEWMRAGQFYQNEPWFQKTQYGGQAHPFNKPYWFEGHINQFLAILAMCEVPLDTTFSTPDGIITMRDMLKNAQMTVNEKEEVTWTLWALSTYLPPDAQWTNAKGERWSIERLVQIEVGKTVGGPTSPCGGTHGLFALARARNVYQASGKPLRGVWYQADQKVRKYIQVARINQNPDGSLSSAFFKGREVKKDFDKRMASTGHQLEFLMMALRPEELREPWVRRAIQATANDLMANRKEYVSCSPLYHATSALTIYLDRVVPASSQQNLALKPKASSVSISKELPKSDPATAGPGAVPPVPMTADSETTTAPAPTRTAEVSPALKPTPSEPSNTAPATTGSTTDPKSGSSTTPQIPADPMEAPAPESENSGSPLTVVPLPDISIPITSPMETVTDPPMPATAAPAATLPATVQPAATRSPMPTAPMPTAPTTDVPAVDTPAAGKPAEEKSVSEEPVHEKPVSKKPADEETAETAPPAKSILSESSESLSPKPMTSGSSHPESGEPKQGSAMGPITYVRPPLGAGPAEAIAPLLRPVPLTMPLTMPLASSDSTSSTGLSTEKTTVTTSTTAARSHQSQKPTIAEAGTTPAPANSLMTGSIKTEPIKTEPVRAEPVKASTGKLPLKQASVSQALPPNTAVAAATDATLGSPPSENAASENAPPREPQEKEKTKSTWKATPPERRRVIVIEESTKL